MKIVIEKSRRLLTLYANDGGVCRSCGVMLSRAPGAKRAEGDLRAPEGEYRVCLKNARSRYHLALGLSYPNARDARLARREGRVSRLVEWRVCLCERLGLRPPWRTPLGGFVMIHGEDPGGRAGDWTAGCFAVENADMDALFAACRVGDRVEILP